MNVKIQERAYQVVIEYLLKELMMKCCSGTTRHAFYNLDLLTLQRCHRHRNALSKRNRFRSFCYEKCCSKPFQSLETPLFFATSMAISHVPSTFFLFKEIDHLDLSILALRKIHNQVVVYLHKDLNSSYVQLESLNVSKCVCGFRALSV